MMRATLRPAVECGDASRNAEVDGTEELRQALLARHFGRLIGELDGAGESVLAHLDDSRVDARSMEYVTEDLHRTLAWLLVHAANPATTHAPRWGGSVGRMQDVWTWVDGRLCASMRHWRVPALERFRALWTAIGTLLTFATAGLVIAAAMIPSQGLVAAAAVFFGLRLTGSLLMGPSEGAWVDGERSTHALSLRRNVVACVASHFNDAIVAAAATAHLLQTGHPWWATAVAGAVVLALLGALARVAAERNGWEIPRTPIERLLRNTTAVGALALTGLSVSLAVPPFALVGAGLAVTGLLDFTRVALAFKLDPKPVVKLEIFIDEANGVRVGVDGPGRFMRTHRGRPIAAA